MTGSIPAPLRPFEAIGERTVGIVEALGRFGTFFGQAVALLVTPPFKVRAFVDFLIEWFGPTPYWEASV